MKGDVKDRSVNLGLWKKIFPYSDLAIPTTGETSYSSTTFALAEIIATAFSMIKLVNFKYIYGEGDLPGWFHRMLYINVENLLSMQAFSDDLNVTLLMILSGVTFACWAAIVVSILSASRKVTDSGSMSWLSSTSYFAIPWIRNALMLKSNIFMCPLIEICVIVIQSPQFAMGYRILGVVLVSSIVLDFFLIVCFSIDINYRPRNILQGRTYHFFLIKVLGLWINIILKYIIMNQDNYEMDVITNIMTFVHALMLLYKLFDSKNFFLQPNLEWTYGMMILVYLVESMGALIFSLNRDLKFVLDMDLVAIISYPLFYLLYRGMENKSSDQILSKRSHTSFDSLDTAILYLEKLFFCFGQAQDDRFKMYLQMNIVSHCNSCKDPMCLCPLLRETIDVKSGSAGRSAKNTFSQFINRRKGGSLLNSTVNFDSISHVQKLKSQNMLIAKLLTTGQRDELLIRRTDEFVEEEVYRVLTIDSAEKFNLVFCSFFGSTRKLFQGKDSFELMFSYLKFLLTEYNNPVTALYAIYDYIYSHEFQRDSSLPRVVLMQSLLRYSKRQALTLNMDDLRIYEANRGLSSRAAMLIPKDEDFISTGNLDHQSIGDSGFSMSQILGFRRRLHQVRLTNMDLILKKIRLYNWLYEPEGDFRVASALGSELYLKSREMKRELAELNLLDQLNPRLIREAIVYEVCVKERDSIPPDYAKRYREAVARFQVFSKSIHSVQSKNRFSPYSSTHVVLFVRPVGEQFKISQFSENATSFFEAETHALQNANLSNFILPTLAKDHDELLHSYLNGEQVSEKKFGSNSIIHSVCRTKRGNLNSVMVIPRLEIVFTQEVFIAGLVTLRKKNQEPIVYSDARGTVLGCNEAALASLGGTPAANSMFLMCPRLKDYYLAREADTLAGGPEQPATKTPDPKTSKLTKKQRTLKDDHSMAGVANGNGLFRQQNSQLRVFWFSILHQDLLPPEASQGRQGAAKSANPKTGVQPVPRIHALTQLAPPAPGVAGVVGPADLKTNQEAGRESGQKNIQVHDPEGEQVHLRQASHITQDLEDAKLDSGPLILDTQEQESLNENHNFRSKGVLSQIKAVIFGEHTRLPPGSFLQCTLNMEKQAYINLPDVTEVSLLGLKSVPQHVHSLFEIWLRAILDLKPKSNTLGISVTLSPPSPNLMRYPTSQTEFFGITPQAAGDPRLAELLQLSPETVHHLFLLKDLVEKNLACQSPSSLSVIQHIFPEEFAEADLQVKALQLAEKQQRESKTPDLAPTPDLTKRAERQKPNDISSPDRVVNPPGAGKPLVSAIFQVLAVQKVLPDDASPPIKLHILEKKPSVAENSSLANLVQPVMSAKVDAVTKEVSSLLTGILEGISVDCGTDEPEELLQIVLQPLLIDSISRTMFNMQQQSPVNSKVRVPSMQLFSGIGSGSAPNGVAGQQMASHLTPVFHSPFDVSKSSQSRSNIDKPSAVQLHSSSSAKVDVLQDDMWLRADMQANSNKEETSKEGRVRDAGRPGSKVDGQANKLAMIDLNKDVSSLISSRLSNRSNQVIVMMRWAINRSDGSLKYKLVEIFVYAIALLLIAAKIVFLIYAQVATDGLFAAQESIRTVALSAHASAWLHKQSIKGLLQSKAYESEGVFYTLNNNGQRIFSPEFPAYILKALTTGQFELANNQFFKKTYILDYPSTNELKPSRASALTLLFDVIFMYKQFQGFSNKLDMTPKLNADYQKLLIDINDQTLGAYNILQIKLNELSDATFQNASVLNLMTLMLFCTNIFFCVVFIVSTRLMGFLQNGQLIQAADLMNKVDKKYFAKAVDTIFSRSKKSADGFESGGTIRRGDATRFTEFEGEDQWDNDFQYKLRLAANVRDDDYFLGHQQRKTQAKPYTVKVWETKTLTFKDRKFQTTEMPSTGRELNRLDKSEVADTARLELEVSPRLTAEADAAHRLMSPRDPVTTYYEPVARKASQSKNKSKEGYRNRSNKQARIQESGLKLNWVSLIAVVLALPTILEIVDYVGVNFNSVAMAERVNLLRSSRRSPDYTLAAVVSKVSKQFNMQLYSTIDEAQIEANLQMIDQIRNSKDQDLLELLLKYPICDLVSLQQDLPGLQDVSDCLSSFNLRVALKLKDALDSITVRLRGLEKELASSVGAQPQTQMASQILLDNTFQQIDKANFYATLPWRDANNEYLNTVSVVIKQGVSNFIWYTVTFVVTTLAMLILLKKWWIEKVLLHDWIQLKHTFLMQNQDVLTNPYVSSFFGKSVFSGLNSAMNLK